MVGRYKPVSQNYLFIAISFYRNIVSRVNKALNRHRRQLPLLQWHNTYVRYSIQVSLPIISNEQCQTWLSFNDLENLRIGETVFCGQHEDGIGDACQVICKAHIYKLNKI